jgi:hypothetical protein
MLKTTVTASKRPRRFPVTGWAEWPYRGHKRINRYPVYILSCGQGQAGSRLSARVTSACRMESMNTFTSPPFVCSTVAAQPANK